MLHHGIRVRVSNPDGVLIEVDSDMMYLQAMIRAGGEGIWTEIIQLDNGMIVEVAASMLDDSLLEDDG